MEPQINKPQSFMASLKKVTPLSKYFAMFLFVLLPFLGGWIGYTLAPEKVVEVEKIKFVDRIANESIKPNHPFYVFNFKNEVSSGIASVANLTFTNSNYKVAFDYLTTIEINPSVENNDLIVALKEKKGSSFLYIRIYSNGMCWHGICADTLKTDIIRIGSKDWIFYKNPYCYDGKCAESFIYELRNGDTVIYANTNLNLNDEVTSPFSFEAIIWDLLESFKFEPLKS